MDHSELDKVIHAESKKYLADLEKCQNDFNKVVKNFVTSEVKKFFLVETWNAKLGALRIKQILEQLKTCRENQNVVKQYLITENQTFLGWKQLVDAVELVESLPRFTNLLVCEIPELTKLNKADMELLKKIIGHFNFSDSKKIIFVTSEKGLLNEYFKCVEITAFLKMDEFENKVTSVIYDNEIKALMAEAANGHVNGVAELLKNGVDVNATDGLDESTALHVAAEKGHKNVVLELLKNGALIVADKSKSTPLHKAASYGFKEVTLVLLENDVDVNIRDRFGRTALHEAAVDGDNDLVKILLNYGADLNAQSDCGHTSGQTTGQTCLFLAALNNNLEVIKTLLKNGAHALQESSNETPLDIAAKHGYIDIVQLLLEINVDANNKGPWGLTAVHYAAFNGHNDVVKALLKYGADINAQDDEGSTVLHKTNDMEVLKTLLNKGARIIPNNINETPLHKAAMFGYKDITSFLLKNGVDVNLKTHEGQTALYQAASKGHNDVVEVLVENNADVNVQDSDGSTALHAAAENNHVEVIKTLLNNGAYIVSNYREETPLHLAAGNKYYWEVDKTSDIVKILLENKADVNAQTSDGSTALHLAAGSCDKAGYDGNKIVNILLDYGADINAKNNIGNTPLHIAATKHYLDVIKSLIERGSTLNIKNKNGHTALDLAVENCSDKVVARLRTHHE